MLSALVPNRYRFVCIIRLGINGQIIKFTINENRIVGFAAIHTQCSIYRFSQTVSVNKFLSTSAFIILG
jgi:hypothetical protein